jgi:hypothetical protein
LITRRVDRFLSASTTDLFNNTDLRQAPGPGAISIWAASDQNDGTINVRIGGVSYAQANLIPNRGTNAPIVENDDAPIALAPVRGGELINVDYTEVTAASARFLAVWAGL